MSPPHDNQPTRGKRNLVRRLSGVRWLRALLLSAVIARPGYWFATLCALVWGGILGLFRFRRESGLIIAEHLPTWAFGRGGTTIGAVFLTSRKASTAVLEHEAIHKAQWRKYGLAFILLYVDAGQDPHRNRFEVEAGLRKGGYV